jgi:hypothetical protein
MQIEATYSEELVKRATMRFWVRLIGWHGFAVTALMAIAIAYLFASGDTSWYVTLSGCVLALALVVGSAAYFVYRHRALTTLRRMSRPTASITLTDAGLSTKSDLGGGDLSWRAITRVWRFPEVWLLFVAKGSYFTIPTEALTDEVRKFIETKVHEHGGRIV